MGEYLKLPEVARRLDVSEKTARRYVKAGALPSVFIGNAYRVSEEDLEEYLRDARVQPEEPPKAAAPPSLAEWLEERCGHAYLAMPRDEFEGMFDQIPEDAPERRELALEVNREYNTFCRFPRNVTPPERIAMRKMIRHAISEVAVKHGIALMEGGLDREYQEEIALIFDVERATESASA
jgi:excisionase family DNA binding protein